MSPNGLDDMKEALPHSRPTISQEDFAAVRRALADETLGHGEVVESFEHEVASYLGMAGGVATSSGTGALYLALSALGAGPGDEVVLPTYACPSVLRAARLTGAVPVLCDVGPDWCMSADSVQTCLSRRSRAVVVVHTFGVAAPVDEIASLGVPVVEDCAQALGGYLGSRKLGTVGALAVCSFQATKLLCTGEGGMVLAASAEVSESLHAAMRSTFTENLFPMSDLQAALGLSQLARFEELLHRRTVLAERYFDSCDRISEYLPHDVRERSIFFRFPLRQRLPFEAVRQAFNARSIHVRRGVDTLIHRLIAADANAFPGAEKCFAETVSIPLYPGLSESEIGQVAAACVEILQC